MKYKICEGVISIGSQQLKFLTLIRAISRLMIIPVMISAGCIDVVKPYQISSTIINV